jgi:peptidyl-prolyl cis-trans isomerase D
MPAALSRPHFGRYPVNKTVSALGGLLVILVAVVFIVQFRPASGTQGGGSGPTCAIEIQGGCISTTHYQAAFRLIGGGFDSSFLKSIGARRIVADGLVERHLLNQDAKRLGIAVSDEDVTAALAKGRAYVSLPADKEREMAYYLGLLAPQSRRVVWETPFRVLQVKDPKKKTFDVKTYEKTIRNITKLSPADFREFQRQEMTAARMRDLIRSRVHVAEAEGYDDYARRKSTLTLSYLELDRNFFADLYVDPSQKAVDEWAAKNADEINKTYEAKKSQLGDECRVARHILAKVRDDAGEEEKAKAKRRIDKALELVNKGEDFAAVARRFSEDGSATKGGDLGCIAKKQTVEPFEKGLWALEEGKVSPIVTSDFGHHIIKLEKIAKGDGMEKVVKGLIARDLYLKHAAETMAAEGAKKIHAAVKGGKSLDDALKDYLAELTPLAGKDADKKPEDDKKDGDKPEADVVENKPFTADNHPDRPLVQSSAPFNMTGNPLPDALSTTELVKEAFKLDKPGDTTKEIVPLRSGYAVVVLKEKTPVKKEEWEQERDKTLGEIRKNKQAEALTLYVQRLKAKAQAEAPIKENQALINPPEEKNETPAPEDEGGEP